MNEAGNFPLRYIQNFGSGNFLLPQWHCRSKHNAMFYDLNKIPIISRLLQNDLKTMMNAKKLLNIGMNRGHMVECFKREGEALFDIWKSPEFLPNMMKFIHNNSQKKKKISNEQPKL